MCLLEAVINPLQRSEPQWTCMRTALCNKAELLGWIGGEVSSRPHARLKVANLAHIQWGSKTTCLRPRQGLADAAEGPAQQQQGFAQRLNLKLSNSNAGADGGTRTRTRLPSQDFKSCVSTGSTTSAFKVCFTPLGLFGRLYASFIPPLQCLRVASSRHRGWRHASR